MADLLGGRRRARAFLAGGDTFDPDALLDGLVAYWTLDEASGDRDDSHGPHVLTAQNGTLATTGKLGQAAACSTALDRFLSMASHADVRLGSTGLTVVLWVQADDWTNNPVLFSKWNFGGDDREYLLQGGASNIDWIVRLGDNSDNVVVSAGFAPTTAFWYFIIAWVDLEADQIGLQVSNGVVQTTPFVGNGRSGTAPFDLGGHSFASLALTGLVDEVGVWRRVLPADARGYLYNGGVGRTYPFD